MMVTIINVNTYSKDTLTFSPGETLLDVMDKDDLRWVERGARLRLCSTEGYANVEPSVPLENGDVFRIEAIGGSDDCAIPIPA